MATGLYYWLTALLKAAVGECNSTASADVRGTIPVFRRKSAGSTATSTTRASAANLPTSLWLTSTGQMDDAMALRYLGSLGQ